MFCRFPENWRYLWCLKLCVVYYYCCYCLTFFLQMPTVVALSIHLKNTRDMSDRNIDMYTTLYTVQLSAVINRQGNFCHITMDFMTCALTFFWANCAMCMSLITNIVVLYEVPNFFWFALLYYLLYNIEVPAGGRGGSGGGHFTYLGYLYKVCLYSCWWDCE